MKKTPDLARSASLCALLLLGGGVLTCANPEQYPAICDPGTYRCTGSLAMRCSADGTG